MPLMRRDEAIALFGTQQKLADALNCAQSSVCEWKEDLIPLHRALQIRELKGVKVDLAAYGIKPRRRR